MKRLFTSILILSLTLLVGCSGPKTSKLEELVSEYEYYTEIVDFTREGTMDLKLSVLMDGDEITYLYYLDNIDRDREIIITVDDVIVYEDFIVLDYIDDGIYFKSNIPQGYGVGSSGALVAALYDKYANDKITVLENLTREKLLKLKAIFSEMESFFHGKSSGLDPLNSYLSIPILINSQDNIEATGIPSQNTNGKGAVFLLDSGIIGETAPMVGIFMEKMKHEGFRSMLKNQFIKHTDACIEDFLKGDRKSVV